MLAFVLASLVLSVAAAPSPHVEAAAAVSDGAPGWWQNHGHASWRTALPSHHHSHHRHHHHHQTSASPSSTAVATNISTVSDSPSTTVTTNITTVSDSPSSASPTSTPPTSSHASSTSVTAQSSSVQPSASTSATPPNLSTSPSAAAYLDPHNALRAKHSAKPLTWSDELANAAKNWASRCHWAHSGGAVGNFGENIAAGTGNFDAAKAVAAWAAEESQYDPSHPTFSHYTQMVWKATTELGCSVVSCPGLLNSDVAQFHVCEYSVPGNVQGQFGNNVS